MTAAHDPHQNYLLAALPAEDFERVSKSLKLVELPLGEALYESGSRQRAVYFPTTAIVSLLYTLADGSSVEIAVVGNEGVIGVSLFMGGETTPSRAVVQSAGYGYRWSGKFLKEEFTLGGPMQHLLPASPPVVAPSGALVFFSWAKSRVPALSGKSTEMSEA